MQNNNKIFTVMKDGKKVDYDVIMTFQNEDNKKNYVVYTDNTYDSSNKLKIYAAIYDPYDNNKFLGVPETTEEWIKIKDLLKKI